jgi:hypothetical protein
LTGATTASCDGLPGPAATRCLRGSQRFWLTDTGRGLREPVEAERRSLEEKITENLTATERKYLLSALAKIYRSASDVPGDPVEHDDPVVG